MRKHGRGTRVWLLRRAIDQLAGAVGPEKMRDIEFTTARLAANIRADQCCVVARQRACEHRAHLRIAAQPQDCRTHGGIRNVIVPVSRPCDGTCVTAQPEGRPVLFHGAKPRLIDELIESFCRGGRSLCGGIEVGFDFCRREKIVEADSGRLRGLANRSGNLRCPA